MADEEQAMKDRIAAINAENKLREELGKQITDPVVIEEALRDTVPATKVVREDGAVIEPTVAEGTTEKQRILAQYGNEVSNIPINSPYWGHKR